MSIISDSSPPPPYLKPDEEMFHSVDFVDDAHSLEQSVKHCRSCWRKDIHFYVHIPTVILGFLMISTCGLVMLVRPSRCCCCGTTRFG